MNEFWQGEIQRMQLAPQSITLLEFIHFVFYSDPYKSSMNVQRIERNKNIWGDE